MRIQTVLATTLIIAVAVRLSAVDPPPTFKVKLDVIRRGYNEESCLIFPRIGVIPTQPKPITILTIQELEFRHDGEKQGKFGKLHEMRSSDLGETWRDQKDSDLGHRRLTDWVADRTGVSVVADFTPKWHAKSLTLLAIGRPAFYLSTDDTEKHGQDTWYSPSRSHEGRWSILNTIEQPEHGEGPSLNGGTIDRLAAR